jgi:beta-glucuronidase
MPLHVGKAVSGQLLHLLLALVCLWCMAGVQGAQAQGLITNVAHRKAMSLNGAWQAIVDPYETGYYNYRRQPYDQQAEPSTAAYYRNHHAVDAQELVEYDFDASPTLQVPGDWNSQREQLLYYEGTVWLKRSFDVAASAPGQRHFVHFGAVNQRAEVYLNGVKLGVHEGGFTPFNFEVTALLKPRGNFLVVKADNTRRADAVPTTSTDWWNYGGITRDVTLLEEPPVYIQDYAVQLQRGRPHTVAGFVQLQGAVGGEAVSLEIAELGVRKTVFANAQGRAVFEVEVPHVQHWSPERPKLYAVVVKTALQSLADDIGFRRIETRGAQLLLNGKPLFLRGISIHEENPLEGRRAHSEADALRLLRWAQELGCNFVRLAHYPHNEHMLRVADRLGLLVWQEIPVYWLVDVHNPATLANAKQQLTEVITRDRNRAASVIWSVANETPPSPARDAFLRQLISHTRALDDTRLVSAALETHNENGVSVVSDAIGDALDIVAFNQYRGWYGGTLHDAPQARWEVRFDKPVVVSEFGGDALQGLHGPRDQRWTEEYQDYLYQQNLAMLQNVPHFSGLSPWILADFRSPRRVLPKVQDGYNRKGLISSQGVRKKAFFTLQQFYRRMQQHAPLQGN